MLGHTAFSQTTIDAFAKRIKKHREGYKRDLIRDLHSPITKYDLRFIDFFEPDSSYIIDCKIERLKDQKFFNFLTSSGKKRKYKKFTKLSCVVRDTLIELYTYESKRLLQSKKYKDYIFLPFTDNTNGDTTYGGGRYLDLQRDDFSGDSISIDFNLCYNPYCAYSSGYSCAIPPKENALPVYIEAGEKKYRGRKKHRAHKKANKKNQKAKLKMQKAKLKIQAEKSIIKKITPSNSNQINNKRYFEPGQEKMKIGK